MPGVYVLFLYNLNVTTVAHFENIQNYRTRSGSSPGELQLYHIQILIGAGDPMYPPRDPQEPIVVCFKMNPRRSKTQYSLVLKMLVAGPS